MHICGKKYILIIHIHAKTQPKYTIESSHTQAALTNNSLGHKDERKSEASGRAQDWSTT